MTTFLEKIGEEARPFFNELGKLRIQVFRDFPYLYDGTLAYEEHYLENYFTAPRSYVVLCQDAKGAIVGASTGLPLAEAAGEFKQPFLNYSIPISEIFYFGESVLNKNFRGQGIGKEFFKYRENYARSLPGIRYTSYCAVVRPENHPLRPQNYQPLDGFWRSLGYEVAPGLQVKFTWKDIDQEEETSKTLQFWIKKLF